MNTKEKIEVMQAWEDGKTVQAYWDKQWQDLDSKQEPIWNWGDNIFRIKPEPKEIWVLNGKVIQEDGRLIPEYRDRVIGNELDGAVKYREVTDD